MTKSDLKELMLVETRNGNRYILINGKLKNRTDSFCLDIFSENLTCRNSNFDIMKIYDDSDCSTYKLIWERKEEKPLTTKQILQKAVNTYGLQNQMIKTVEELAELSQAMCKSIVRLNSSENGFTLSDDLKSVDNLFEEMADVEIMLAQCKIMFQCEKEVEEWKEKKIARLAERLKDEN